MLRWDGLVVQFRPAGQLAKFAIGRALCDRIGRFNPAWKAAAHPALFWSQLAWRCLFRGTFYFCQTGR
jgi:hypothetical protein